MIDKEKIEKGLRCCIEGDHCNSTDCPYYDAAPNIQGCTQALCQDALALLKEQEAVESEIESGGGVWWYVCGECHGPIDRNDRFCRHCGREVKWE